VFPHNHTPKKQEVIARLFHVPSHPGVLKNNNNVKVIIFKKHTCSKNS